MAMVKHIFLMSATARGFLAARADFQVAAPRSFFQHDPKGTDKIIAIP